VENKRKTIKNESVLQSSELTRKHWRKHAYRPLKVIQLKLCFLYAAYQFSKAMYKAVENGSAFLIFFKINLNQF